MIPEEGQTTPKKIDKEKIFEECVFKTSKSSGPGGQHVNKTESRVTLEWNFVASSLLNAQEKMWVAKKGGKYMVKDSILQISADSSRSQLKNKEETQKKLVNFIRQAFTTPKKRKPTKPTLASVHNRLKSKKIASQRKSERGQNHKE